MEQIEKKPLIGNRSKEQILSIIADYKKSNGITVKEFCKQQGIREGTFYSFRSRYQPKRPANDIRGGFIAITTPASRASTCTLFAEVNGIKIYQAVPADYLKALAS